MSFCNFYWLGLFGILPGGSICLPCALYILTRVSRILFLTAFVYSVWLGASSALRAPLLTHAYQSRPLSRALLTSWIRQIMVAAGIPGNFSSHSFRIGAATVVARSGVPDHVIQALGHRTSNAFQLYIRTQSEALAGLSSHTSRSNN